MQRTMTNNRTAEKLHSLISLADFKAVLGTDDREDALSRYCLVTATYTIEQYCMRRLLRGRHFERLEVGGDLILPLREYPVASINSEQLTMNNGELVKPEFYRVIPDFRTYMDIPYSIELSPEIKRWGGLRHIRVVYTAGYLPGKVPADLASACLELAAWNMGRYRGRRIGMTGAVRGQGRDGEHYEMSLPLQVRQLLDPYKRKTI